MVEIKRKVTLHQKGDEAYVSIKQLMVMLHWTVDVDLDLMAFYKAKDGRVGGTFSDNYPGGTLGSLNSFPFIELSGDEGHENEDQGDRSGGESGEYQEVIRITKLDDHAEVFIVAINYDDAIENKDSAFSHYDGGITVINDRGEAVEVPLPSDSGVVAVICKIDNTSPMGAKLVNMNEVMSLGDFVNKIPGANLIAS